MPSILAVTPYPHLSADTRYRISQFIPGLLNEGWHVELRSFMDDRFYKIYNKPGRLLEKLLLMGRRSIKRFFDVLSVNRYDAVVIHKEAFPFGPPIMEYLIKKKQPNIIYDMDDAFWSHPPQMKQIGRLFRDPHRIEKIIRVSKYVLAGNEFLASYAKQYNSNVIVFPTVIDTKTYFMREEIDDGAVTIGWVGRWSSSFYLQSLVPVFEELYKEYSEVVDFKFIGAAPLDVPENLPISFNPWRLESEVEDLIPIDIGIMPLPDDIYTRGKCGLKLLQYMGLGIPAVASPVGVNQDIISDGVNGYLANNDDEWFEKLSLLILDKKLRKKIGLAGREHVRKNYSLERSLPKLINVLNVSLP